ncbi:MAG: hypothetical protein ACXVRA_02845, partial [Gaiellaceae bacterium]
SAGQRLGTPQRPLGRDDFGPVSCLAPVGATWAMGGPSDAATKMRDVTELTRSERTSQLLVARLDALATVAAQLHHVDVERLIELASIATMNAVALETLHAEKAEEIWRDAHQRHPQLRVVEIELPETLAA